MITFSQLGLHGRLGNQLFQYAFLRLQARRLSVPFCCPEWIGDSIFHLDDESERAPAPKGIDKRYVEPPGRTGFNSSALEVEDGTDLFGYFQTERYCDKDAIRGWYRFKEGKVAAVRDRFRHVDFANSTGVHLRFGDFTTTYREHFYVAKRRYYQRGLRLVPRNAQVLVFSDDIPRAKAYLGPLGVPSLFVEGNEPYEDLYLQTLCRDFICAPSTFSWWGAWLNAHPDKVIVAPGEGPFRPGSPFRNDMFWPEEWIKLKALGGVLDHHRAVILQQWTAKRLAKLHRKATRLLGGVGTP